MIERQWQDHVEARFRQLGIPFHSVSAPGTRVADRVVIVDYEAGYALHLEQTDPMNRDIVVIISAVIYEEKLGSYDQFEVAHAKTAHAVVAFVRGWIVETGELDAEWDQMVGQG